jgi:hypothetical protein
LVEDAGCLGQLFGSLLLALGCEPTLSRYSAAVPQCAGAVFFRRLVHAIFFPDKPRKSLRSVASRRLVTSRADPVCVAGSATCGRLARGMEHKVAEIGVQKSPHCTGSISRSEVHTF